MKVLRIQQGRLRNEEWYNFFSAFKGKVIRFDMNKLDIAKLFGRFVELLSKVDKVLEVLQKSVHTKEMEEADHKRDELVRGLIDVVKGSQKQPAAAKQKAAINLYNLLSKYKKLILQGGFAEESSSINNLVDDLRQKYDADVVLLGLTEWVQALDDAEKEFQACHDVRQQESFNKPKEDLKRLRAETDRLYTAMANNLDSQLLADGLGDDFVVDPEELDEGVHDDGTTEFTPELHGNIPYNFVVSWNEEVKKYRNLLAQRAGRHSKDAAPEDGEE